MGLCLVDRKAHLDVMTMPWLPAPEAPALPEGAVHLWRARFSELRCMAFSSGATLSPDETARAQRFAFDDLRRRFVLGRGFLRAVLGRYLVWPAHQVALAYTPSGKPYLPARDHTWLRFNLAHAGDLLLLAVTRDREIGVDVEPRRPIAHTDHAARIYFSPGERRALAASPDAARLDAFLSLWTSKEAYGKAKGTGLASFSGASSDGFDYVVRVGERELLPWAWDHAGDSSTYYLRRFVPDRDYWGAFALQADVAAPSSDLEIVGYQF